MLISQTNIGPVGLLPVKTSRSMVPWPNTSLLHQALHFNVHNVTFYTYESNHSEVIGSTAKVKETTNWWKRYRERERERELNHLSRSNRARITPYHLSASFSSCSGAACFAPLVQLLRKADVLPSPIRQSQHRLLIYSR
jgi:hypothetical protein